MLSTVDVFAAGFTNNETLELQINGSPVQVWTNVGGNAQARDFVQLRYETNDIVDPSEIRVAFTNDVFDADAGIDYNVRIDRIVVDGVTIETESPQVFSTGTYTPAGLNPGFLESEVLHTNGYFQYPSVGGGNGDEVQIRVRGDEGTERFNLLINERVVGTYDVSQQFQTISYRHDGTVDPGDVRVEFVNDQFDGPSGFDSNLVVDFISIEGTVYQTEDPSVFSTGVWDSATGGPLAGFRQTERLHVNGYFQYGRGGPDGNVIQIRARGDEGFEQFNLLINDNVVNTYNVSQQFRTFTYTAPPFITADNIKIEFINDAFDPANGIDSNLIVDYISINGTLYQTEDPSVFSTGTYNEDGLIPGFRRSEILHTNGFFQYSTGEDSFSCANVSEIPMEECEALVAIYNANPDTQEDQAFDGWLESNRPSDWRNVVVADGHVNALLLLTEAGRLTTLPSEIGNLTQLERLEFRDNRITSLPPGMGNLTSLTELDASLNRISTIATDFWSLPNLETLNLALNNLSELPPEVSNLSSLRTLNLANNALTSLPQEIIELPSLERIVLSGNPLGPGSVPQFPPGVEVIR